MKTPRVIDDNKNLDSLVSKADVFASIPSALPDYAKVIDVCKNPNVSAIELYNLINADPCLTVIMQNLFIYLYPGSIKKFTSLEKIIIALNINTIKNVALDGAKEFSSLKHKGSAKLWRQSLMTAVCSLLAAKERGIQAGRRQVYWTAGLISGLGKIESLSAPLHDVVLYSSTQNDYNGEYADLVYNTAVSAFYAGQIMKNQAIKKPDESVFKKLKIPPDFFEAFKDDIIIKTKKIENFILPGAIA
ncbi:hypothetical protein AGMMS50212_15130 [Spirochaetia bacterium]|nr:hypothetical protein AGMMS50212_15130 [Spirochaetia bacterium]